MKIFVTIPDFSMHGGIRIILEWANRLTAWHDVYLYNPRHLPRPTWFELNDQVKLCDVQELGTSDLLLITSPHSINLLDHPQRPRRVVLFLQMLEHLFRPQDRRWKVACERMYRAPHPMLAISQWNIDELHRVHGRVSPTYLVGNGVNLDDFFLDRPRKDGLTILVEGWESLNPSKDPQKVAPKVARRLAQEGYRIVGYSQANLKTYPEVLSEYYHRPTLGQLNKLYAEATILLKATRYDARSCAPMEAMTKGTPTVRGITKGDDDLVDGHNCLRVRYDEDELYQAALRLLNDPKLYLQLQANCQAYVQAYGWDHWLPIINTLLCQISPA